MPTDVEIAQSVTPRPMEDVAADLGLSPDETEPFGRSKLKVFLEALDHRSERPDGRLILVTAITPTPAGEGKTTTTIGLGDGLRRIGKKAAIALREPSLGPCFGIKGGATGGGYAQVIPMADINLHFTGDFHAITSAHNLLAAMLDNSLYHGNEHDIDIHAVAWRRVVDLSDRALREIVIGLGDKNNGIPRQSGYDITTASEIMALLCLANGRQDLQERLARIVVAYADGKRPVTAQHLNAVGAMAVLLKDALKPNLVQTLEGTPAFVHGGPFGNIAHGCNSVLATRMALKTADYVVTEAGFGSDLGAEKFFDIKCRTAGLKPDAAVVVATLRALKLHGGVALANVEKPNPEAVAKGVGNLAKHIENVRLFGLEPVVAINRFPSDTEEEIGVLGEWCSSFGVKWALSDVWAKGGAGATDLAHLVVKAAGRASKFAPIYPLEASIRHKIEKVATLVYGAEEVEYSPAARTQIKALEEHGYASLPICVAKTQYSLSDNPKLLGRPHGFTVHVREAKVSAGAGFIVVYAGSILTMPGLPKEPAAFRMGLDANGNVFGLS
jgi:formate--tetrahydrofolate ligase